MANKNEPGIPRSNRNSTSGSGQKSSYSGARTGGICDWASVSREYLFDAVQHVTYAGDALLMGRSVDGGVLVLTVCAGAERIKFYARTGEEMDIHLRGIIEAAKGRSA